MPGVTGILTPGRGPNGPGPIDMRAPITSVGNNSTVPYGPTNGYATPNGVTGFIGPAAGSLQKPTIWYARSGGSNTNGGTSTSLTPEKNGSDGVLNSTTTFTSASANFSQGDVGKGIFIQANNRFRIVAVANATTCTLSSVSSTGSSLTWAIGGAMADLSVAVSASNPGCVRSGDICYLGAGVYRAVYGVNTTPAFNGQVNIVGDVTGQFTGDAGMVQMTAYTTNDKTAPSATTLLNLNGKSNLAFSNIMFVGGNATMVTATTVTSQNISFTDCCLFYGFTGSGNWISAANAGSFAFNWRLDRCLFIGGSTNAGNAFTLNTVSTGNDYSANVLFQNCVALKTSAGGSTTFVAVLNNGTLTFKGGGVTIRSCTIFGAAAMTTAATQNSTVLPCFVYDSLIYAGGITALQGGTTGELVEDYNLIVATTPRSNVGIGAHSISDGSYAPLFHFGQERIWLPPLFRAFGEPMAGSPLLGFGNDGGQTPYDLRGPLWQRPAGGSSALPAVGAMERSDTFIADPTPIGNDTTPIKITGPGYNDILLPISLSEVGQARNLSIAVQWDANYYGTLPSVLLVAKPQMGVTQQQVVATGASGSPHTITLAPFTPSATGVLNIRLMSFDQSGSSVVEWDSMLVS